ncbi:glycine cleavage system aminomethyltransferase GcvT [Halocatena marina]|uniref:glycine cleavage system aminomethyltransferase GcvT n=1 Tax=Halocatena marina TaxID=2934937 RepID=UPI002814EBCB|nr:glycine cleavage system aminomethyltransferase GcvT [Halocatena marina]
MSSLKTPLYDNHREAGAGFTMFNGWEMPVKFDSITTEHTAVRDSVGRFDVSHMGEILVRGPDAAAFLHCLTPNDVTSLAPGEGQYSCFLRNDGVIIDDTVLYHLPTGAFLFVPNAGNDRQIEQHCRDYAREWGYDIQIDNLTESRAMIAVQGPDAIPSVEELADCSFENLSRFGIEAITLSGNDCLVAKSGYTGEDGVEIILPTDAADAVWSSLAPVQSCGLGARDTLRLEAGLLLSGQDFHPVENPRTPLEANISFVIDWSKEYFIGKDALKKQAEISGGQTLVGLAVEGRGIARNGYKVLSDDGIVGEVTSGTQSLTFEDAIALAYIDVDYSAEGTELQVRIRNREIDVRVVNHRFLATRE